MAQLKHSKQRDAIKKLLMNRTDHPTADTVYTCIREEYPNISLGTVYRNLSLLVDLGEISKISTGGNADRYDANTRRHHHFICTCCENVYDLESSSVDGALAAASQNFPGKIENFYANFYGTCQNCLEQKVE